MNKRIIALILCLFMLIFLISACKPDAGKDGDSQTNAQNSTSSGELSPGEASPQTTDNQPPKIESDVPANENAGNAQQTGNKTTEKYFSELSSGFYHMKIKMSGLPGMNGEMEIYAKDGLQAMRVESELGAMRVVHRDNKVYSIIESQKMYIVTDIAKAVNTGRIVTEGMNYLGSGAAEFNGRNLPYDEYTNKDGYKMRLFTDGGRLAGIQNIAEETVVEIIIFVMDKDIPDGVFEIPSDYQEIVT